MYYVDSKDFMSELSERGSVQFLNEKQGCVAGCCAGMTVYNNTEYTKGGVHQDQEGFFVLEGCGMASFGEEEFAVYPGLCMVAPAGVRHRIKRNEDSEAVKVFWFHSAVN